MIGSAEPRLNGVGDGVAAAASAVASAVEVISALLSALLPPENRRNNWKAMHANRRVNRTAPMINCRLGPVRSPGLAVVRVTVVDVLVPPRLADFLAAFSSSIIARSRS